MIFDSVENFIMEWTMPNESRICRAVFILKKGRVQGGVYPKEKKRSVAGHFAVKYRSETYSWTQKLSREDSGVDKYWVILAVVTE